MIIDDHSAGDAEDDADYGQEEMPFQQRNYEVSQQMVDDYYDEVDPYE